MPLSRWQPPVLRRDAEEEHRVTWLELFFDLVFVASLIQLGNVLADDLTWAGAARFAGLFVLLYWNWAGTTVFMNRIAVDDWVHRLLVMAQMLAVASMAVNVPVAFTDDAGFALSFVVARVLLVAMWARATRSVPQARELARVFGRLFGAAVLLWAGSLLVPTPGRFWLWAAALLVETAGLATSGRVRGSIASSSHGEVEHLQERFALFTIIVLGEGFVKATDTLATGTAAGAGPSATTLVFGALGLVIMGALWWTYFDDVADAEVRRDGTWMLTWANAHMVLAGAVTAFGVSLKKLVEVDAFGEAIRSDKAALLAVAVVVALLATAVLDLATRPRHFAIDVRHRVVPRLVGAAATGVLLLLSGSMPALAYVGGVAVVVVAQIAVEVRVAVRGDRWVDEEVASSLSDGRQLCPELASIPVVAAERLACAACTADGTPWVSLRLCVTCGHVGCCDSSPGRHGTGHHEQTGHPVMRTLEPDAHWAWCFVHETTLPDWRERRAAGSH